uniref:Uncharacterized protein n=1 Tax=Utricularia reniformis TaxID=192314 RepID=A0A1Y0B214_9LAMI|nr:hypothetical protein AEK19_MT1186 [Utricularia reniformis]ART31399.1 hypothetical protein AEK19_MT1186 [Utricularia reniformis]
MVFLFSFWLSFRINKMRMDGEVHKSRRNLLRHENWKAYPLRTFD